jgi:hypothetical protein
MNGQCGGVPLPWLWRSPQWFFPQASIRHSSIFNSDGDSSSLNADLQQPSW